MVFFPRYEDQQSNRIRPLSLRATSFHQRQTEKVGRWLYYHWFATRARRYQRPQRLPACVGRMQSGLPFHRWPWRNV